MYIAKVVKNISEISQFELEKLNIDQNPFHGYDWLKNIEQTDLGLPRYILVYKDQDLVAIFVCYVQLKDPFFTLSSLMFFRFWNIINTLTKSNQGILVCYSPMSFSSGVITKQIIDNDILQLVRQKLIEICEMEKIFCYGFMNIDDTKQNLIDKLQNFGFHKLFLFYNTYLPIAWNSYEEYLMGIKKERKRMYKVMQREIKKVNREKISFSLQNSYANVLSDINKLYDNTYSKYTRKNNKSVFHHRNLKNPFTIDFWKSVNEKFSGKMMVYTASESSQLIAFSLILPSAKEWYAYKGGLDYRYKDVYFMLFYYLPISDAIKQGVKTIHFGPGNYKIKMRRGCKIQSVYSMIHLTNNNLNWISTAYFSLLNWIRYRSFNQLLRK